MVLEDGAPVNEAVTRGSYEYFKMFVSRASDDLRFTMTAFLGNPDMFVSITNPRPNASSFDFSSYALQFESP